MLRKQKDLGPAHFLHGDLSTIISLYFSKTFMNFYSSLARFHVSFSIYFSNLSTSHYTVFPEDNYSSQKYISETCCQLCMVTEYCDLWLTLMNHSRSKINCAVALGWVSNCRNDFRKIVLLLYWVIKREPLSSSN